MDLERLVHDLRRVTVEVITAGHGAGAGVVCGPESIVTNAHVIRHPRVQIRLADGRRADGLIIAWNRAADLALVRVPGLGLPEALPVASGTPRVGSLIVAIGHPLGMRGALTTGIVHAVGPITPGGRQWIQADVRLAPGNSGGPLADPDGRLIGVNAMIVGNLALAIPVTEVSRFVSTAGVPRA